MAKIHIELDVPKMPAVTWDAKTGKLTVTYEIAEAAPPVIQGPRLLTEEELTTVASIPDLLPPPPVVIRPPAENSTASNEQVDYGKVLGGGGMSNENSAE